jgi:large subunit ribosomal protein L4
VPATKQATQLLRDWGQPLATLVLLDADEFNAGLSFRNLERVLAMPVEDAGVADVIGAASLLISDAALGQITARANGTVAEEVAA